MSNDQNDAYDDDFERNEDNAGKDNNFDKNNYDLERRNEVVNAEPTKSGKNVLGILRQAASSVKQEDIAETRESLREEASRITPSMKKLEISPKDRDQESKRENSSESTFDRDYQSRRGDINESAATKTENSNYRRDSPHSEDKEDSKSEPDDDDSDEDCTDSNTPEIDIFFAAIYRGDLNSIQKAMENGDVTIKCRDRHGWTVIHWAVAKGYDNILKYLISEIQRTKQNISKLINTKEKITGWTPLHLACVNCHLSCVAILIRNGAKLNVPNDLNEMPVDCIGKSKCSEQIYDLVRIEGYADSYREMMTVGEETKFSS